LSESLESGAFRPRVRSDFLGGLKSGVNGTPTFFINGRRYDEAFDFDDLVAAIEAELANIKLPT
jgi:protein-disulfide isomerase